MSRLSLSSASGGDHTCITRGTCSIFEVGRLAPLGALPACYGASAAVGRTRGATAAVVSTQAAFKVTARTRAALQWYAGGKLVLISTSGSRWQVTVHTCRYLSGW